MKLGVEKSRSALMAFIQWRKWLRIQVEDGGGTGEFGAGSRRQSTAARVSHVATKGFVIDEPYTKPFSDNTYRQAGRP